MYYTFVCACILRVWFTFIMNNASNSMMHQSHVQNENVHTDSIQFDWSWNRNGFWRTECAGEARFTRFTAVWVQNTASQWHLRHLGVRNGPMWREGGVGVIESPPTSKTSHPDTSTHFWESELVPGMLVWCRFWPFLVFGRRKKKVKLQVNRRRQMGVQFETNWTPSCPPKQASYIFFWLGAKMSNFQVC